MITLFKISKFLLYASLAAVLVVMSTTFFPFIGGKYYFFRVSTELSLIALLLWWAFEARAGELETRLRRLFRQPLFVAVSLYVLAYLLAALFSDNVQGAFWSNFERGDGGFQMLHYYLFFILIGILWDSIKDWHVAMRVSLFVATGMIGYGLLAASHVVGFIGPYNESVGNVFKVIFSASRFQGSLGNPAYVAPYLLFIMFFALWEWVVRPKSRRWNIGYAVLLSVYLIFFILSQTRGAFLGLIAGGLAFLAYLAFAEKRFRKVAIALILASFLAGTIVYATFSNKDEQLGGIPGGRLLTTSLSAVSAQTRLWTWGTAARGFLARPVFGWGPENFSTVFDRYFDTRHYTPGTVNETWFDRAHSIFFDSLAATGILGFATFLGIFFVFYRDFFRHRKKPVGADLLPHGRSELHWAESAIARALLFAMPVAYLVQGAVLFDVLPIYLNLFLFLAFATFVFEDRHPAQPTSA